MEQVDLAELRRAKSLLENPGLAIKIANVIGKPVEWGLAKIPQRAHDAVVEATKKALETALSVAIWSLDGKANAKPKNWLHRLTVIASGATSGIVGLAGLPIELPFSTTVMVRSIADHARAQGEDLSQPEARMNCLLVLALGGTSPSDDAAEVAYFAVRAAFAKAVAEAAEYFAERVSAGAVADKAAPVLARLVAQLTTRFAPSVADKVAAQLVPVLGAIGGAAINTLFINHFQDMASGHFTIRRLERQYGVSAVRAAYDSDATANA